MPPRPLRLPPRAVGLWLLLGAAAAVACGDGDGRLPATPKQALEAWDEPALWRDGGPLACDPTPRQAATADDHGRCRHIMQMPPLRHAAGLCGGSGGSWEPGLAACLCPGGGWFVAGQGCQTPPLPGNREPGCPEQVAAIVLDPGAAGAAAAAPARRAAKDALARDGHCLQSLTVGRMHARIGEPLAADVRTARKLFDLFVGPTAAPWTDLVGPPEAGQTPAAPWLATRVDHFGVAAALGQAASPGGGAPARVQLWGPGLAKNSTTSGTRQGRCAAAWGAALPAAAAIAAGEAGLCGRLWHLKSRHQTAARRSTKIVWRAVELHPERPAPGLDTVIAWPEGEADAWATWVLAEGAVLQRRLHLRDPSGEMLAFVDRQGELAAIAGWARHDGQAVGPPALWDADFRPLTGGGDS